MTDTPKRRLRLLRLRQGARVEDALRLGRLREVAADPSLGQGGRVFIVDPDLPPQPPAWVPFVQTAADEELPVIASQLNGAIILVERAGRLWVLT